MANIYDVVTAPILATKWNERLRERTPFLGEALFTNTKQLSTELSYLKGGVQKPKLLNLSAYYAKAIPVDREGFEKLSTEIPFYKNFKSVQEKERRDINNALASGNQAVADILLENVYNDKFNLINMAHSTLEYMRMKALTEGAINFSNNGVSVSFDYGLAADQKKTLSGTAKWDAAETADPIADIIAWQEERAAATGVTPNAILMDTATLSKVKKAAAVKNAIYVMGDGKVVPNTAKVKEHILNETGCTLYVYDKGVNIGKNFVKFVEEGKVVLFDQNNVGKMNFSVTPEESDLMTGTDAIVAVVDGGIAITTTKETDPVNVKTKVSMAAMPSLEGADYIVQVKVY